MRRLLHDFYPSVCVEILFFSKCVSISVERKFAGPGGDPTFDDLIKPDHWEAYCLAFAPAPPEFTGV